MGVKEEADDPADVMISVRSRSSRVRLQNPASPTIPPKKNGLLFVLISSASHYATRVTHYA